MTNKLSKLTVFLVLTLAISLVLASCYCFADTTYELTQIDDSASLDIDSILSSFSEEYLNEYADEEVVVIATFKDSQTHSIANDLSDLDIEERYSFDNIFYGQSISIKIKDIYQLSTLSYIESVSLANKYYCDNLPYYSASSGSNEGIIDNDTAYQGDGIVVAIIDASFDTSHIAFSSINSTDLAMSTNDISSVLYSLNSYKLSGVSAQNLYVSDKICYAYDYADKDTDLYTSITDHGTHVAGIIGGDSTKITGVVPNAQLAFMKVADSNGYMYDDILVKALEDCITLGVDVINMSLGGNSGFSEDNSSLYKAVKKAEEAGITVVCAAGNEFTSAYKSESGSDYASEENIDNSSLVSPANYSESISTADAEEIRWFTLGESKITYVDVVNTKTDEYHDFTADILGTLSSSSFDYVVLANGSGLLSGTSADYEGIDANGKIVVLQNGDLTLAEKMQIAKDKGAIGIIVVLKNNAASFKFGVTSDLLPTAVVTKDVGTLLIEAETKSITFNKDNVKTMISEVSSQGVTNDLELGVDMAAFGTGVYSTISNQEYQQMSGTSMATPNLAGAYAAVRQYIRTNAAALGISTINGEAVLANQLLMSNTTLLTDLSDILISPRRQGAGFVNLTQAVSSGVYISTDNTLKTKIELKDNLTKNITLNFTINNTTASAITYNVDIALLTEKIVDGYMRGYDQELTFTINSINNSAGTQVLVPANSQLDVSISFTISDEAIAILNSFTSGTYVEGYIMLEAVSGSTYDISCPFIGFWGDWDDVKVLDVTAYDDEDAYMRASKSYGVYADSYYLPLGEFVYKLSDDYEGEKPKANEEFASLSIFSSSMYYLGYIQLGLLRSAEYIEVNVVDLLTGEVIESANTSYATKTMYNSSLGSLYGGDYNVTISPYALDLYNNAQYEVQVNVYRTYDADSEENTISDTYTQKFYVDEEAPEIEKVETSNEGSKYYATFTLSDNHYIQALLICTGTGSSATNVTLNVEDTYPIALTANGVGQTVKVKYDVTDAIKNASNGYLYFYVVDYAQNSNIYYYNVSNWTGTSSFGSKNNSSTTSSSSRPTTDNTTISKSFEFKETEIEVSKNSEINLASTNYLTGYSIDKTYTWTSSDTSIVAIEKGKITGLQTGIAVVTVKDSDGNEASIAVKVKESTYESATYESTSISSYTMVDSIKEDNTSFFGINLDSSSIKLAPGESFELSYSYTPYNYNYIDNPIIITIEQSPTNLLTISGNRIKATASGTTTLTIKANGATIATYDVVVVDELYVSNGILLACFADDVTINLDSSIKAIGQNAFSYAKNVTTVNLGGAKLIYKNAFKGNTTIQTITGLSNVTAIYEGAFEGCSALTSIDLSSATMIGENAFKDCVNLTGVTFANYTNLAKASIASNAFSGCAKLDHFVINSANVENLVINNELIIALNYESVISDTTITTIGKGALSNINIATLDLRGMTSLQRIETEAFKNNTTLKKVILPSSVNYIGISAFAGCTSLASFIIEKADNQELTIAEFAFKNTGIYTVDLSGIETTIQDGAFYLCKKLTYANVGSVQEMGKYVFAATPKLTSVVFEEGSVDLGTYTFAPITTSSTTYYHASLKKVTIPSTITEIKEYTFAYCSALTLSESALENVKTIGDLAFASCTSLSSLSLDKVEKLAYAAFAESSIQKVSLNRNMTSGELTIGELAFYQCEYLTTCLLPTNSNVTVKIEKGAFYQCKELVVYSKTTSRMSPFQMFTPSTPSYTEKGINFDRVVLIGDYAFTSCESLTTANLPACKEIGYAAFAECEELKTVTIPVVETIEAAAFYDTAITELTIPNTIQSIGQAAFCNTDVAISLDSTKDYSSSNIVIDEQKGGNVVYIKQKDNTYMLIYYPKAVKVSEYTILANTSIIGEYAFVGNESLESVIMQDGIKAVGHGAFYGCESLSNVIYKGSTLPKLLSSYSSTNSAFYCNFVSYDQDDALIVLFVKDSNVKTLFESNKSWANVCDYVLVGDETSELSSFMSKFSELAGTTITSSNKSKFESIKKAYEALSDEDKQALSENEAFTEQYNQMLADYNNLGSSSSNKSTEEIIKDISEATGLKTWVIIAIAAGIGIVVVALAVGGTIIIMKRKFALKKIKEQSRNKKSIEDIFSEKPYVGNKEEQKVEIDVFEQPKVAEVEEPKADSTEGSNDNNSGQDQG